VVVVESVAGLAGSADESFVGAASALWDSDVAPPATVWQYPSFVVLAFRLAERVGRIWIFGVPVALHACLAFVVFVPIHACLAEVFLLDAIFAFVFVPAGPCLIEIAIFFAFKVVLGVSRRCRRSKDIWEGDISKRVAFVALNAAPCVVFTLVTIWIHESN
jgi:hypothetical protein